MKLSAEELAEVARQVAERPAMPLAPLSLAALVTERRAALRRLRG